MRVGTVLGGLVLAAAAAGCSALGRAAFQQPVVQLRDVRLNGVGLQGGAVDIVLSVHNPNHFSLDGTRLTYKLYVDTVSFGTGATDSHFAVNGSDSTDVHLPLSFTWSGVGEAARQLMNTGTVNYRVTGDLTVGSAVGTFTLPYDRTGRFSTVSGASR